MNIVKEGCQVQLLFDNVGVNYTVINQDSLIKPNVIRLNSPLGKAILGKKEGELIRFSNSSGEKIKVKILKIM